MKILFAHQNMPGQYRELVQYLAAQGGHELVFLTQRIPSVPIAGVKIVPYRPHHVPSKEAYGLSKPWEEAAGAGFGAMMAARELERTEGFRPDLILGHTGWGSCCSSSSSGRMCRFWGSSNITTGCRAGWWGSTLRRRCPNTPPISTSAATRCPWPASRRWTRAMCRRSGSATAFRQVSGTACMSATTGSAPTG